MDGGIASRLKQFDAYPKTLEDFRVKTFGGAVGKHFINKQHVDSSHIKYSIEYKYRFHK